MLPCRRGTIYVLRVRTGFHTLSLCTFDRLNCTANAKLSVYSLSQNFTCIIMINVNDAKNACSYNIPIIYTLYITKLY